MEFKISYTIKSLIWQHSATGGWFFVSLPDEVSKEIRENLKWMEEGWGRLKASAKIGESEWESAIWYDTKRSTYLLPLKSEIRKKEKLKLDQEVTVIVRI
jgi:hypothetical protein